MPVIYHITTQKEWEIAKKKGFYEAVSLVAEGFIHCSEETQLPDVQKRYYSGQKGLVKLVIDTEKLESRFVYEWSPSIQDTFPHIYGPINLEAVIETVKI